MISAKEARKMTRNYNIIPLVLTEVDLKVKESARKGEYKTIYKPTFQLDCAIFYLLLPVFTELGYKITWFNNLNQLLITWRDEE